MSVKIEKLVFGGQALAHHNDKTCFVWNALPGEDVELEIIKKRKGIIEARASKIISPSSERIEPSETHYLCCSPWSIMTREAEIKYKLEVAKETFHRQGKNLELPELNIVDSPEQFGYRNKIEFSFTFSDAIGRAASSGVERGNQPSLAFFNRGTHQLIPLDECLLAHPNINTVAKEIVAWARSAGLTVRNLKSVIIRSNLAGEVIAALFIKDVIELPAAPARAPFWKGFEVFYSTHKSPASVPDKLLLADGGLELSESVGGVKLSFGIFSFFQINLPIFSEALKDITEFVEAGSEVVDYYSGVGAIGLALATKVKKIDLVESNVEACELATRNISDNKITNATITNAPSELLLDYITADKIIILDPPRAGLDKRLVERLLAVKPKRVIYLSCGPDTQARDLSYLAVSYRPVFARLYNFFPRTPHFESLVVLDLK